MNLSSNTIRLPSTDGAGKHDRYVVVPHGTDMKEAIAKINEIISQANKEDHENGGVCLDGGSVSENISKRVGYLGFSYIYDVSESICWDEYVPMRQSEKDERAAVADEEFASYHFGDDVTVVQSGNWDKNDLADFTKVVYIRANDDHPDADSEKVSFHVRFNDDGTVSDAYGLLMRTGADIGHRPPSLPEKSASRPFN